MKIMLVMSLLFLTACGYEIDPRTLWHARSGAKHVKEGAVSEAQKDYLEALGVDPFVSELHANLGLTYHVLKQPDSALQSYESAERWARNSQASFVARFNQGVLRGESKKIEEALQVYQRALKVRPDSIEVKTNIELLIQQSQSQSGEGEKKEQNEGGGQGQSEQENKDQNKQDQEKEDQQKNYQNSPQYKPREFKGDLSEQDVKKILGELKQQEQKIRGQFHRNETKEKPRDKDW